MRVKNRQSMQKHIAGAKGPVAGQDLSIGQKVVLCQHGALGSARCAGGIEEGSQIFGVTRNGCKL